MVTNTKPVCKCILLKLNGEALQGTEGFGADTNILDRMAQKIKELVRLGTRVSVVIGRGNPFRGAGLVKAGTNRVVGDHTGVLATVMNGLVMHDTLYRAYVNARLVSAISLDGVHDSYSRVEAISLSRNNRVVILSAGTGDPLFATDSAACLRGTEIKTDVMPKATKVNGVFITDPAKDPIVIMYEQLTHSGVLERELKVTDLAVFTPARDHRLSIRVFNMNKPGTSRRVVMGEKEETLVTK